MFWRTKESKGASSRDKRSSSKSPAKKTHAFHVNPAKSWSYYNQTSQHELFDIIKAKRTETASTSETSAWSSRPAGVFGYEKCGDEMSVDEDGTEDEEDEVLLTPEGVTRIPFTSWEVDLLGTARLSSYYQGSPHTVLKSPRRLAPMSMSALRQAAAQYSNTPHNSPRHSP
jgi:hypothetical protein